MAIPTTTIREAERFSDHGQFAGMMRRMVAAYQRRIADADPYDLVLLMGLRDQLDEAIAKAVTSMHETGFSWAEIAEPLGITRQAAQQRWGAAR